MSEIDYRNQFKAVAEAYDRIARPNYIVLPEKLLYKFKSTITKRKILRAIFYNLPVTPGKCKT